MTASGRKTTVGQWAVIGHYAAHRSYILFPSRSVTHPCQLLKYNGSVGGAGNRGLSYMHNTLEVMQWTWGFKVNLQS